MSKKQEVMKQIQEKITMSDEEFNNIYSDMEKAFKDREVKPTEEMVLNRIISFLTPTLKSPATKRFGIFLGVEDNYGFNKINDTVNFKMAFSGKIKKLVVTEILPDEFYKGEFMYRLKNPRRTKTDTHGILAREKEII